MSAPSPIPFRAVLFDLDGTLVATDRYWIPAARAAARRVFVARGVDRPLPTAEDWMRLVGYPLAMGLRMILPDLDEATMEALEAACVEEEERLLKAGGAALLPGAQETLEALAAAGVRLGIASNCSRSYLALMMDGLGLSRWVSEARCLDSAGCGDKGDMVADLLLTFGTRSAVMVGDRVGDMDAGRRNGLPCIAYTGAFGDRVEAMAPDAELTHLGDLPGLLRSAGLASRA